MAPDGTDRDLDLNFLRESAREFLAGRGEKESLQDLAAMDWTGLLVDEALGGAGWSPVAATVVAEEIGRAVDRSAWFGTVLAGAALATAPEDIGRRWLPGLLDGSVAAGLAVAGDTVRVLNADRLDLVVTLGTNDIRLYELSDAVPRSRDDELLDVGRPAWRVELGGVDGASIGDRARAEQLLAVARVLLSADSLGATAACFDRLVEYLKNRTAFGAPIASFQAVQHRLVELLVFEAKARAVVLKAARALSSPDGAGEDGIALAAVAHAFVTSKAAPAIDECMQLSGGIGFTWEYPLHHELRRAFTNGHLLGTSRASRTALVGRLGW